MNTSDKALTFIYLIISHSFLFCQVSGQYEAENGYQHHADPYTLHYEDNQHQDYYNCKYNRELFLLKRILTSNIFFLSLLNNRTL